MQGDPCGRCFQSADTGVCPYVSRNCCKRTFDRLRCAAIAALYVDISAIVYRLHTCYDSQVDYMLHCFVKN